MKKSMILLILFLIILTLPSCYTDTVNNFTTFTIQIPVYFYDKSTNRKVPSIGYDFSNLYKYDEYKKNKERINRAELFQFAFWVDSLIIPGSNKPFDPKNDEMIFDSIKYTLVLLKPKPGKSEYCQDPFDFDLDSTFLPFNIGDFHNVKISEYYKNPKHIINLPEEEAIKLSNALKSRPYFFIVSEYSRYQNQPQDTSYISYLEIRTDLVIRLSVNL
jgi:hypothetical protein